MNVADKRGRISWFLTTSVVLMMTAESGAQQRGRSAGPSPQSEARQGSVAAASANLPQRSQASGSPQSPGGARGQIDTVYELASAATTVKEIQDALSRCDRISQETLAEEDVQYLRTLQGWLLNRRGEAFALAATRAIEQGQDDEALQWEQKAAADFGRAVRLDPQWRAFHNRGVSLAMLGEFEQALASFNSAIELNPDYSNTRFNRAELWLEIGQYAEAEQEYSQVLRLAPGDIDSLVGRAHARFYQGQFDSALEDFNAVIGDQPDNAIAFADRADLHAYLGNWEQAATDYRKAIGLDRSMGRAYQSAAWLMATCPDERFRDPSLALRAAQRALELDGQQDYRYLDTLAAAQASASQFEEALATLQEAFQVAPEEVHPDLQSRQALYEARQPYRDVTGEATAR